MANIAVNLHQGLDHTVKVQLTGKMKAKNALNKPPEKLMKSISSTPVTETA